MLHTRGRWSLPAHIFPIFFDGEMPGVRVTLAGEGVHGHQQIVPPCLPMRGACASAEGGAAQWRARVVGRFGRPRRDPTLDALRASLAMSDEDGGCNMESNSFDDDARDRLASRHRGGPRTQDVPASVRSEQDCL